MKPVLFLVYNRFETSNKVFDSIKAYKPLKLYLAADGPKNHLDYEKCKAVRDSIIQKIDWNCDVKFLFREVNLGCKKAVITAIDWFFENEEEGIILEDDCLPNTTFFQFCEQMLDEFKGNRDVMHISGCNFFDQSIKFKNIFFSKFCFVWGWATWRESWKSYDHNLGFIDADNPRGFFQKYSNNDFNQLFYWEQLYSKLIKNSIDTWDYQWMFSIWNQNGLCIVPPKNLIKNIGFSESALHTQNLNSPYSKMKQNDFEISKINKKIKVTSIKHELFVFYHNYLEQFSLNKPKKSVSKIEPNFYKNLYSRNYSLRDKLYFIKLKLKGKR